MRQTLAYMLKSYAMHKKATRLNCQTFQRAITTTKFYYLFKEKLTNDLLLNPNQYTKYEGSSSNTFWDIVLKRFHCYFIKREVTLKWEIIQIEKYGSPICTWGIHISNLKILAYIVLKLGYAQESVTNERTKERYKERTDKPEAICPRSLLPPPPTHTHTPPPNFEKRRHQPFGMVRYAIFQ